MEFSIKFAIVFRIFKNTMEHSYVRVLKTQCICVWVFHIKRTGDKKSWNEIELMMMWHGIELSTL